MWNRQSYCSSFNTVFVILVLYSITDLIKSTTGRDTDDTTTNTSCILPTIDEKTPTSIKTIYGQNAYLHCLVNNLCDKKVSWYRQRSLYILSVGNITYTGYVRMKILPPQQSNDWILQIKPIPSDSGMYECQVNTEPKLSIQVNLTTIDPDDLTFGRSQILLASDKSPFRGLTVMRGHTAYLNCITNDLGNNPVFWSRGMRSDVLSLRRSIYTNDTRFRVLNLHNKNEWVLQIKNAKSTDSGMYECLVSQNPLIRFLTNLTIVDTRASIGEDPEIYIKNGSSLNLTCVVALGAEHPVSVFWQHNEQIINNDSAKGVIVTEEEETDTLITRLFIREVQPSDSGYYTCCPSNAEATRNFVLVLNGEPKLKESESKACIEEDTEIYVKKGSSLTLTCGEKLGAKLSLYVVWQYDQKTIANDSEKGVIVTKEVHNNTLFSKVFFKRVQQSDSGYYTCFRSNSETASIFVIVLSGEPNLKESDTNQVTYYGENHPGFGENINNESLGPVTSNSLLTHLMYHGDLSSFKTTGSPLQDDNKSQRTYDAEEQPAIKEDDFTQPFHPVTEKSQPTQPVNSCN